MGYNVCTGAIILMFGSGLIGVKSLFFHLRTLLVKRSNGKDWDGLFNYLPCCGSNSEHRLTKATHRDFSRYNA